MNAHADNQTVANFYDTFASQQIKTGVNIRHRTILRNLKRAGLQKNSNILEIGCGIGTLTGLVGGYCNRGTILAADISPESIEIAKKRTAHQPHIQYVVTDMSDFSVPQKFDFVVLPDVLEHIPVEYHRNLFATIRKHIHAHSIVAIHIPDPYSLDWYRKYQPEKLQIIDQSLYTNLLAENIYANDLFIDSLTRHALHTEEPDYQWIVVKPNAALQHTTPKTPWQLKWQSLIARLFY